MKEFKSDFEFKDDRTYIHSSTLIEEMCRFFYENYYSEEKWGMPIADAKFHKPILFNGKFLISENSFISPENVSVSADFRFYDGKHNITAVFVANEGANVVRRIKTSYSIEDVVLEKDFSGTCKIGCPSRAAFTENIIEANKRIHLLTLKDKNTDLKVTNLYMKRFPVYLSTENYDYILLKIENISVRLRDGILATLNSLYFPQLQSERFEMVYTVEGL